CVADGSLPAGVVQDSDPAQLSNLLGGYAVESDSSLIYDDPDGGHGDNHFEVRRRCGHRCSLRKRCSRSNASDSSNTSRPHGLSRTDAAEQATPISVPPSRESPASIRPVMIWSPSRHISAPTMRLSSGLPVGDQSPIQSATCTR